MALCARVERLPRASCRRGRLRFRCLRKRTRANDQASLFPMQPSLNDLRGVIDRLFQGTFPDDSHTPAKVAKHCRMACVPVDISLKFPLPEFAVRLRGGGVSTAFVPVPETAVNEYHGPVFREHQIGRARQISYMKPVPESPGEQKGAKRPFRPSILSANARHHAAALGSGRDPHGLECIPPGCLRRQSKAYNAKFTAGKKALGAAVGSLP